MPPARLAAAGKPNCSTARVAASPPPAEPLQRRRCISAESLVRLLQPAPARQLAALLAGLAEAQCWQPVLRRQTLQVKRSRPHQSAGARPQAAAQPERDMQSLELLYRSAATSLPR